MNKNLLEQIQLIDSPAGEAGAVSLEQVSKKDIAIIGMGVKFPRADSVERFWHNLRHGVDCIGKIPGQRKKDVEDYLRFINGTINGTGAEREDTYEDAAYLEEIDKFDYRFFRLSPREASLMDPNQRLFLQTAWAAIEDAGYGGKRLMGTRTGVYVGFGGDSQYKELIARVEPSSLSLAVPGNLPPIIASRLSYLLDLKGPSLLVNTVCSSSLVAVHLACQAIRSGECDLAVAGGVQTYILPIRQAKVGIEASDFKTKTFDYSSDGTGSGEGVAAILLKPLTKAVRARDHIYAVIKGGAVNQDGRSIGISAPNPAAQEDVITRAWQDAGVDPETISYIEAHGTGTKLGDPIEIEGLERAFARYTGKKQFCAIGSVKTNLGHLDNSAGIAGLIKAALALKHKEVPPSLHFNRPNRKIPFHKSPVYVNNLLQEWEAGNCPRRCGVSSFSFSGTNCHLVLEEAPGPGETEQHGQNETIPEILTLSAETREGLKRLVEQYKKLNIENDLNLGDVCFTANTGRGHYSWRLAMVIRDERDFKEKLDKPDLDRCSHNHQANGVYYGTHLLASPAKEMADNARGVITPEQARVISNDANERLITCRHQGNNETLLYQVCELYIKGADIDWDKWYHGRKRKRVSLPPYPFEPRRCWLHIPPHPEQSGYYYTTGWKQEELPENPPGPRQEKGTILILKDKQGIGDQMAARFRAEGRPVLEADNNEKLPDPAELEKLRQIIHMQTLPDPGQAHPAGDLEKQLQEGVYSLFHLVRAILKSSSRENTIDIVLISAEVNEVTGREREISPGNAALFGLGKVVNLENFNLKCRAIDIDNQTRPDQIIEEINAGYTEYKVAYRSGKRYVEEMKPVDIAAVPHRETVIKPEGVYIITGGTRGLGLEIAGHLASGNRVNLALVNRSAFPDRGRWQALRNSDRDPALAGRIKAIEKIEETGSRVLCCSADVSREEDMVNTLVHLRKTYGKINGIVHCAAVGSGRAGKRLADDTEETFNAVMAPKVQGTWILDRLTRQDHLDFFVVFSSPITLMGGPGSGSYTAANAYLDSFAAARNKAGRQTMAMSWAPWEETLRNNHSGFASNKHLLNMLSTAEITEAFSRLLGRNLPMVIIGKLNYKSEIFNLGAHLPFRLTAAIKEQIAKTQNWDKTGPRHQITETGIHPPIKLIGRKNNDYSTVEREIAQLFGQFLGYREIRIDDNFYELGGDSIIAIKIVDLINLQKRLGINAADLLQYPSVESFAEFLEKKYPVQREKGLKYTAIFPLEEKEYYDVSPAQRRIFLLDQREGGGTGWNISYAMKIEGHPDKDRMAAIFQHLVRRHEILRTSFQVVAGELVQKVDRAAGFKMDYKELEAPAASNGEDNIKPLLEEFIKPFDLSKSPLLRVRLLKGKDWNHVIFFDIHHIIADEVSMDFLVGELAELYPGEMLPELKIQYRDFSAWQNDRLKSGQFKSQETYWLSRFNGEIPVLHLPTDYQRPPLPDFSGERTAFALDTRLSQQLSRFVSEAESTLYWTLMAVFYILLSKYTGQEDIVVGMLVDGRTQPDLEKIFGMFVNVLPLRNYPRGEKTFRDFLKEVKASVINAYANQEYPFHELVDKLNAVTTPNRNPLFDVSFQMHKAVIRNIKIGSDLKLIPVFYGDRKAKHDLFLEVYELKDQVYFELLYSRELFGQSTIDRMIKGFMNIINLVIANPGRQLRDLKVVTELEKKDQLEDFNEEL